MKRLGKIVLLEGPNGVGKSTTAAALEHIMRQKGLRVRLYRDPGQTQIGDKIRALVKDPQVEMFPMTQMLMYTAARAELALHMKPWIEGSGHVVLDRWWPSTYAYQGAGGVDADLIMSLATSTVPEVCRLSPALTFYINIPVLAAMERSGALKLGGGIEGGHDRFEIEGLDFQYVLHDRYMDLVHRGMMRQVRADAFNSPERLAQFLWEHLIAQEVL